MNLLRKSLILLITLSLSGSACAIQSSDTTTSSEVKNLTAFSKLYGYVKYFHPSDEAQEIDWDRLAVLGVKRVKKAKTEEELKKALEALFLPIAPTISISETESDNKAFLKTYVKRIGQDTTRLKTVAWQHLGVDLDNKIDGYTSVRINRNKSFSDKSFSLYQTLDHSDVLGNRLKLDAAIKANLQGENGSAELYIRATDENNRSILSEHTVNVPNNADKWQRVKVEGRLDPDAVHISVGIRFKGIGRLWMDGVHLEVQNGEGGWKPVPIKNAGFETEYSGRPSGWRAIPSGGIDAKTTEEMAFEGSKSLSITSPAQLFDRHPYVGETLVTKIGKGLWSEVPLALYSDESHTLPRSPENDFERLKKSLKSIDLTDTTGNNENVRLADIVVAWNELQHFYPYFDVIDTDWEQQLSMALKKALADDTQQDFNATLSRMLASTRDGHIILRHSTINKSTEAGLPFLVDWIENKVVVTQSWHQEIQLGDIVKSIDGEPASSIVKNQRKQISGSPQLSLYRSLRQFGAGASGTEATVEIKREGKNITYTIPRSSQRSNSKMERKNVPVTGQIEDGVYYVDLTKASMPRINKEMSQIASSPGVIFDLRGYPNMNYQIIRHLLTRRDTSDQWLQIPKIIYPDQRNMVGYQKLGWHLTPVKPHIRGNVVFITDARAISNAESVMNFIKHYDLGKIVGQPTAGTNGGVNTMVLPGGFRFGWTAMKVVNHDGSQHFLRGIRPTIPIKRTVQGVREGKDEFLEKAIKILK